MDQVGVLSAANFIAGVVSLAWRLVWAINNSNVLNPKWIQEIHGSYAMFSFLAWKVVSVFNAPSNDRMHLMLPLSCQPPFVWFKPSAIWNTLCSWNWARQIEASNLYGRWSSECFQCPFCAPPTDLPAKARSTLVPLQPVDALKWWRAAPAPCLNRIPGWVLSPNKTTAESAFLRWPFGGYTKIPHFQTADRFLACRDQIAKANPTKQEAKEWQRSKRNPNDSPRMAQTPMEHAEKACDKWQEGISNPWLAGQLGAPAKRCKCLQGCSQVLQIKFKRGAENSARKSTKQKDTRIDRFLRTT